MPIAVLPADPCTISIAERRIFPRPVFAKAVRAGIIASRKGRATVAPSPRRAARREMWVLVMNMSFAPGLYSLIRKSSAAESIRKTRCWVLS